MIQGSTREAYLVTREWPRSARAAGQIAEIESGKIGPFDLSQTSLVIASLIVILPTLMIALSLKLRASATGPPISRPSVAAA